MYNVCSMTSTPPTEITRAFISIHFWWSQQRMRLAAFTTARVRKELKALKRVPKFKYLDCESSVLQSAELLPQPGKNAKKVEKRRKKNSNLKELRQKGQSSTIVSLTAPFSVYSWVFMCKTYANTCWIKGMTSETSVGVCDVHMWPACASSLCVVPCVSGPDASWF